MAPPGRETQDHRKRKLTFVVKVPLRPDAREQHILEERLRVRGQLKNTAVAQVVRKAKAMRSDPAYAAAARLPSGRERSSCFRQLRLDYGVNRIAITHLLRDHWRASKWMPLVLDAHAVDAIAPEVHAEVDRWLYGYTEEPRPQRVAETDTLHGSGVKSGLRWSAKHEAVLFPQPGKNAPRATVEAYPVRKRGRKDLVLPLSRRHAPGSRFWAQRIGERRIVRTGLTRERGRRGWMWFALFTVEGAPYRNRERALAVAEKAGQHVGLDVNVSNIAVVGEHDSALLPLVSAGELETRHRAQLRLRRRQRALDRSRRASNPNAFDCHGRLKPGARLRKRSKRAKRLEDQHAAESRRNRLNADRQAIRLAQDLVARYGTELAFEKNDYSTWQRQWGKRVSLTRPGTVMARLRREALLNGGSELELALSLALSQQCLCRERTKKTLKQRRHACASCGLGVEVELDRDLFSALLARLAGQLGINNFCAAVCEGTLADEYRRLGGASELTVTALCAAPSKRVPSPSPRRRAGKRKTASRSRQRGTSTATEVRALDGLPPQREQGRAQRLENACQTDGTTPSTPRLRGSASGKFRPATATTSSHGQHPHQGPKRATAHSVGKGREMSDSGLKMSESR